MCVPLQVTLEIRLESSSANVDDPALSMCIAAINQFLSAFIHIYFSVNDWSTDNPFFFYRDLPLHFAWALRACLVPLLHSSLQWYVFVFGLTKVYDILSFSLFHSQLFKCSNGCLVRTESLLSLSFLPMRVAVNEHRM